jgi:hypothetical protein
MSRKKERIVPNQVSWNLSDGTLHIVDHSLVSLPTIRKKIGFNEFKKSESEQQRPAYISKNTLALLLKRTKYNGDESSFLKTLKIFPQGTFIFFEKREAVVNKLYSQTIVHEVNPRDDWDVPSNCRWYQVISNFSNDEARIKRNCVCYVNNSTKHPLSLSVGEYFYASPNDIASSGVYLSKINKTGWGKLASNIK